MPWAKKTFLKGPEAQFVPWRDALAAARDQALAFATMSPAGAISCTRFIVFAAFGLICSPLKTFQRVTGLHETGDTLRPAGAGEQADLDLREADPGFIVVSDDPVMAGQREFKAPPRQVPLIQWRKACRRFPTDKL